jgi:MFS transporter, DHA2 family, multidrug resistance protein
VNEARAPPLERGRVLISLSIMLATVMQVIDTTIANVALPHMQGSLSATQDEIAWVLTSYIVAAAIATPLTGWVSERIGRRTLLLASISGFVAASGLCGAAQSLSQMIAFRLLQGVFGAALVPLSQAVLLDTWPRQRHGQAMALFGVGVMIGPILGPTLGGWLTENYDWRWVFYINLPIGALAFLGVFTSVPRIRAEVQRVFDFFGFAALSIAVGSLQLMLDRGERQDWFASWEILIECGLSISAFWVFAIHIAVAKQPFLDRRLLRDRNFVMGLCLIFVLGMILVATIALLPSWLEGLLNFPIITTGFVMAPRGVGTLAAMLVIGRLLGRVDARAAIAAGLAITAYALWRMTEFNLQTTTTLVVATGIVQGIGIGLIFVPLSTVTFATLDARLRGDATAFYNLVRNVGSSIGISLVESLLATNTQRYHAVLTRHINPFNKLLHWPNVADAYPLDTQAGLAAANAEVTRQAAMIAYLDDFRLMMAVAVFCIPLVLLIRGRPRAAAA